jgi:hypothetical protein
LVVALVLVYLGEGLSVLAVLFSAHPTADTSNKTAKMGDNFVTLIAWTGVLIAASIIIPPLYPPLPWGFAPTVIPSYFHI